MSVENKYEHSQNLNNNSETFSSPLLLHNTSEFIENDEYDQITNLTSFKSIAITTSDSNAVVTTTTNTVAASDTTTSPSKFPRMEIDINTYKEITKPNPFKNINKVYNNNNNTTTNSYLHKNPIKTQHNSDFSINIMNNEDLSTKSYNDVQNDNLRKDICALKQDIHNCINLVHDVANTIQNLARVTKKIDKRINGYQCIVCKSMFHNYSELYNHCIADCQLLTPQSTKNATLL